MATIIKTDGTKQEVTPANGKDFKLAEMYQHIGNGCDMVQAINLADGRMMWMDEESKLKATPPPANREATVLLAKAGGMPGDVVLGNVLSVRGERYGSDIRDVYERLY